MEEGTNKKRIERELWRRELKRKEKSKVRELWRRELPLSSFLALSKHARKLKSVFENGS